MLNQCSLLKTFQICKIFTNCTLEWKDKFQVPLDSKTHESLDSSLKLSVIFLLSKPHTHLPL